MKKNWLVKVISSFLVVIMIMGLVGCSTPDSGKTTEKPKETNAPASSNSSNETAGTEETEGSTDEISYPLNTDVKLSIWTGQMLTVSADYSSWKESPFHTGLEKKTGVTMEWTYPTAGSELAQAYNLLWVDKKDMPHIVYYTAPPSTGLQLLEDGLIYDLTEYLPKYAPDYWEYINRPENRVELKSVTTDDGRLYSIPAMREGDYNITYMGPIIRQDWLDECNLEHPVTIEDWEKVLVAFKNKYNATLGCNKGYFNNTGGIASGVGAFAALGCRFYLDENGKVQIPQLQAEWKELMEVLNRWWEMGLIDPDFLTLNDAGVRTKAINGEIGITFVPMSQFTNIVNDAEAEKTGANWVGMEYPRTAAGAPTNMVISSAAKNTSYGAVITTKCSEEEMIAALQWLNYGYTEEGIMYWNYGEEGVSYTLDKDDKPVWTDVMINDPKGINESTKKYTGAYGSAPTIQQSLLVAMKNSEVVADAVYLWTENTVAKEHYVPSLSMTTNETERYNELWSPITTYIIQESTKFFTGDRPLSEYDDFVAKIKELGSDEVLAIQQAAYDRFLAK